MKPRNTIILVLVLAALAAYVYFVELPPSATPTPTPAPETKLLDLNADDVTGLQVSSPLSRTVAHLAQAVWQMDEPTKEEADTSRLNNLVLQLAKLKATGTLTDTPTNLAPFGLMTGTLTMTLQMKDNHSEVVRFGNATLGASAYYAQRPGDPKVYLVSPNTYGDLTRLLEILPKKPTPPPTAAITPTPEATGTPTATPDTTATPRP
ncbi:MAG: DUF4340 domain-containing protein [Chloroflexi bacterium]|nr:DUF4340 domain-containing protein [Chloroflexota bacterium]